MANKHHDNPMHIAQILPKDGRLVKARMTAAGLKLGDVARAAKISQSSLSNYLRGLRRKRAVHLAIWDAYRRLSLDAISLEDFWGDLLSKRIAS